MMRLIPPQSRETRKLARPTSQRESKVHQFLGRNKSQVRLGGQSRVGQEGASFAREGARKRYRGRQSSSCSWRRYASHETKLIEKKQFVEGKKEEGEGGGGGGGESTAAEEEKRPPERINTTILARRREFFAARLTLSGLKEKEKKKRRGGGTGFARLAVARMNNQTRRGREWWTGGQ